MPMMRSAEGRSGYYEGVPGVAFRRSGRSQVNASRSASLPTSPLKGTPGAITKRGSPRFLSLASLRTGL